VPENVSSPPSLAQMESMTDDELRATYDSMRQDVNVGLEWYRDEIHHREIRRRTDTLVHLTWLIAGLTALNAVFVAWTIFSD
jgi:hypothetical protein